MSALATPQTRPVPAPTLPAPRQETPVVEAAPAFSETEMHRWVAVIIVPFVLGAAFFGLALGLGEEWPMVPAFMLGPFVMIAGYIYLSLTSEANTTSA